MGRNSFRFYINPKAVSIGDEVQIETPHTLTFQHGASVAVIEVRLPVKGERTWQCFTDAPLGSQMREMLTDWGGDGPGWEAKGDEENGKPSSTGEHDACYHVTVIAAFTLGDEVKMLSQDQLMKAQGFKASPVTAAFNAALVADYKASRRPEVASVLHGHSTEIQHFLSPVIQAMNAMEEIGGPSDADYLVIMESIANEARRRAETLKANLGAKHTEVTDPDEKITTITVTLEIKGDAGTATQVVESVLDAGVLQDAINEHGDDDDEIEVVSAVMS